MSFLKNQWFSISVLALIVFNTLYPTLWLQIGKIPHITLICTVSIFFILGLGLKTEHILKELIDFKIHLIIQISVFILVPLVFIVTLIPIAPFISQPLKLGIIALACLPTTVSFASTMAQIYGGNVIITLVNSTIANTLGIIIVPFILTTALTLSQSFGITTAEIGNYSQSQPIFEIMILLLSKTILPLSVGQCVRFFARNWVMRHTKKFSIITQMILLIPIAINFARIVVRSDWSKEINTILTACVYIGIIYIVLYRVCVYVTKKTKLSAPNRLSFTIICPQKSLVVGVPFINIYFNGYEEIGLILLPLLFYHPWQIFIGNLFFSSKKLTS